EVDLGDFGAALFADSGLGALVAVALMSPISAAIVLESSSDSSPSRSAHPSISTSGSSPSSSSTCARRGDREPSTSAHWSSHQERKASLSERLGGDRRKRF